MEKTNKGINFSRVFDSIASKITKATGSAPAFIIAFLIMIIWIISGPLFNFSDTWQLVINTGTTIITFLMVFIIQQSQNKDTVAIHLKLNELIACNEKASNRLIDIEELSDQELQVLRHFYINLTKIAAKENDIYATHSLDEASQNQQQKNVRIKKLKNIVKPL